MNKMICGLATVMLLVLSGCDSFHETDALAGAEAAASNAAAVNLNGEWAFEESVFLLFPGEMAMPLFGVPSEGPVLHVNCEVQGIASIVQNGAEVDMTSVNLSASCLTRGGATAQPPWPNDPSIISGMVNGRSIQMTSEPDAAGISCIKRGAIRVQGGTASEIKTSGGCDLRPFPFRPVHSHNAATYTRL